MRTLFLALVTAAFVSVFALPAVAQQCRGLVNVMIPNQLGSPTRLLLEKGGRLVAEPTKNAREADPEFTAHFAGYGPYKYADIRSGAVKIIAFTQSADPNAGRITLAPMHRELVDVIGSKCIRYFWIGPEVVANLRLE